MKNPVQGGCACGEIRYECSGEPVFVIYCHCRDCQRASGGAMGTTVFFGKDDFRLLQGTSRSCVFTADSGNLIVRHFCGTCGSPLFTDAKGYPGIWGVKIASLDDPAAVEPQMHIWTDSAQPWDRVSDQLPQFPKSPPAG